MHMDEKAAPARRGTDLLYELIHQDAASRDRPRDAALAHFLLARIGEDGAAAISRREALHLALGDESLYYRLLAECEAKRDLVEGLDGASLPDTALARRTPTLPTLAREWLQLLAEPYAAHPDYRNEWRA